MSLAVLHSRALSGLDAPEVTVEVHLANGLPSFTIVGLPDTEVKESRDRVRAALVNSRFDFPARRITVNLAPAELPKESGRFDLPIALGILAASHQLEVDGFSKYEFAGELSLTGELRPVRGALAMTWRAARERATRPDSSGSRRASSTLRLNSGSSSRNSTPLWASDISPGRGSLPPPTNATLEAEWCGARNGRCFQVSGRKPPEPSEASAADSSASSPLIGGSNPAKRAASIDFPVPGGPTMSTL